jgi:hypothetical protein
MMTRLLLQKDFHSRLQYFVSSRNLNLIHKKSQVFPALA